MTFPKPTVQNIVSQAVTMLTAIISLRLLSLLLFVGWFLACFFCLACFADPPLQSTRVGADNNSHSKPRNSTLDSELDFSGDPELKPLVDRSKEVNPPETPTSFNGNSQSTQPAMLSGKVESLDNAIRIEQGDVDWYGWYLSARQYLSQTGGLDCTPGTPIRFNRSGIIQAQTGDMTCRVSTHNKFYPLPSETRFAAIILPVRQSIVPPATRDELYRNIRQGVRQ